VLSVVNTFLTAQFDLEQEDSRTHAAPSPQINIGAGDAKSSDKGQIFRHWTSRFRITDVSTNESIFGHIVRDGDHVYMICNGEILTLFGGDEK
jgi:hypothetical protein